MLKIDALKRPGGNTPGNPSLHKTIMEIFLISVFLLLSGTGISQNIISRTTTEYPSVTTYSDEKIILPVVYYREGLSFTVPLQTGFNTGNVDFEMPLKSFKCTDLLNTSTLTIDPDLGKIDFNAGKYCDIYSVTPSPDTVTFQVKAIPTAGGDPDYQVYKIPMRRIPIRTVVVMDISGSMGAIVSGSETRWMVLKSAVESFTMAYEYFRQEGDMVGLTYFTTYVIQPDPAKINGFIPVTAWDAIPSSTSIVKSDMDPPRGPLYLTAMGKGLLDAKTKLKADITYRYRKFAVLFTDGLQNVPPLIDIVDGNSLIGTTEKLNDPSPDPLDNIIYLTLDVWTPSTVSEILSKIADVSGGVSWHSTITNDADLQIEFANSLQTILNDESPQIVGTSAGIVNGNQVIHTINLNANIPKTAFIFSYGPGDSINVEIEKGGTILPIVRKDGSNFALVGLQFPLFKTITSEGTYKIKVSGRTSKQYNMICIADDHHFDYDFTLDKSVYTVGDTIRFTSQVSIYGLPVSNPGDSVVVVLLKPGDDVGNLLSIYDATQTGDVVDPGTPAQQKFNVLFNSDTSFSNALLPVSQRIVLGNLGNGTFKGEFAGTEVTGVYNMLIYHKLNSENTGVIEREKLITTLFKFGQVVPEAPDVVDNTSVPQPPDSTASSSGTSGSTTPGTSAGSSKPDKFNPLVLQIRPKNKFGNFMGPGYASKVDVKIKPKNSGKPDPQKSAFLASPVPPSVEPFVQYIHDNLDGRYFIYIADVQKGTNPKIEINIGGESLYTGKVFRIPAWFVILILILLVLLFLIWYFKPKNVKVYNILLGLITVILLLILLAHQWGYLRFLF